MVFCVYGVVGGGVVAALSVLGAIAHFAWFGMAIHRGKGAMALHARNERHRMVFPLHLAAMTGMVVGVATVFVSAVLWAAIYLGIL